MKDALLKYVLLPPLLVVFIVLCQIASPAPSPWDLLKPVHGIYRTCFSHEVPPTTPGLGYLTQGAMSSQTGL